mgnify:CR=1 FL=1
MPRRARLALPNVPLHLIQRGNNRQACFFSDEDYRLYLDWLGEHAGKTGCRVHAYVLMINHVRSFDVPLSFQPPLTGLLRLLVRRVEIASSSLLNFSNMHWTSEKILVSARR